jgi:hypothetical protein
VIAQVEAHAYGGGGGISPVQASAFESLILMQLVPPEALAGTPCLEIRLSIQSHVPAAHVSTRLACEIHRESDRPSGEAGALKAPIDPSWAGFRALTARDRIEGSRSRRLSGIESMQKLTKPAVAHERAAGKSS